MRIPSTFRMSLKNTTLWCIGIALLVSVMSSRFPSDDESLIGANLVQETFISIYKPLPFFDQASPLGYRFISRLALTIPTDHVFILRAMAAILALLSIPVFISLIKTIPQKKFILIPIALVLMYLNPTALRYATEIKHYFLETVAVIFILNSGVKLDQKRDIKNLLIYLVACIFSILNMSPSSIFIAATSGALLVNTINGRTINVYFLVRLVLIVGLAAVFFVVYYFTYLRPTYAHQLTAYSHIYNSGYVVQAETIEEIVRIAMRPIWYPISMVSEPVCISLKRFALLKQYPVNEVVHSFTTFVFVLGVSSLRRRSIFLFNAFLFVFGLMLLTNILGFFPFVSPRHFIFMLPIVAIGVAYGFTRIIGDIETHKIHLIIPFLILLTALCYTLVSILVVKYSTEQRNISKIVAHLERNKVVAQDIWLIDQAQPTIEFVRPYFVDGYAGKVPHASGLNPFWDLSLVERGPRDFDGPFFYNQGYLDKTRSIFEKANHLWLLFTRDAHNQREQIKALARTIFVSCAIVSEDYNAQLYECTKAAP